MGLMIVPVLRLAGLWREVGPLHHFLAALADSAEPSTEHDLGKPPVTLPRLRGFVRFHNVAFRHRPEQRDVLAHINLDIQPGQLLWVVGRSGAGKTTLALLLARLLSPTAGTITLDGFDLATVASDSLRAQISFLAEEPVLLPGTIRYNIALAEPEAALERVIAAAQLAGAHDFIMRFPLGYETTLGAFGVHLSRGQRQSLCIARALLKEPRLLILDEVTASLDAEMEHALLQNLRWLGRDSTTLLLTRRPQAVDPRDAVVVLEDGQIVETGTHGALLTQNGLYAHLAAQRASL
jgi:ATP-binding cassette subfamily B protein